MDQTTPIVDFGQWSVEHLRLTVFHPPHGVQTSEFWELLMGVRPESIEERPREGLVQQHGEVDGNRLLLVTHAERLDWTFVPNPTVNLGANITPALTTPALIDPNQAVHKLQEALDISEICHLRPGGGAKNNYRRNTETHLCQDHSLE